MLKNPLYYKGIKPHFAADRNLPTDSFVFVDETQEIELKYVVLRMYVVVNGFVENERWS